MRGVGVLLFTTPSGTSEELIGLAGWDSWGCDRPSRLRPLALGAHGQGTLDVFPLVGLATRRDGRCTHLSPQTGFVSILSWPHQPMAGQHLCPRSSQVTPLSPGSLCTSCRRVWQFCLCLPSPRASGCCVSVCVCVCVHVCACTCTCVPTCPRFHLASLGRRCLLSGCCEPGMLVSSVVCLLTLLRGPLSVLLRPQIATSSSVWCLRFCVFSPSVHFCLRPSICPRSHHAHWVLWVSAGPTLPLGLAAS